MEAELRLNNLRHFLRISQVKSHSGKGRVEHSSSREANLTATTGRAGIFGIESRQCLEGGLTLVDTVGITTEFILHAVEFINCYPGGQLDNLNLVLNRLAQGLGIISMEVIDINVSGRCAIGETEARMSNILIPPEYRNVLAEPTNTPYKIGHLIRINDQFALLRTRWDWSNKRSVNSVNHHYQDLLIIPQLLMGMFR
jgi:hypothetical protein